MQQLTPPEDLHGRIIEQVQRQTLLRLRRRIILFGTMLTASLAGFAAASTHIYSQINDSGFMQILSLSASDFKLISANFGDYVLSLVEAFPIMALALFCLAFGLVCLSLFNLARSASDLKNIKSH